MSQYDFTKTTVAADRLTQEIRSSTITKALDHISVLGSALSMFFKDDLSEEEQTTLATIVTNHSGLPLPDSMTTQVTTQPFASKQLCSGKKLFRRCHGIVVSLPANDSVSGEIVIPYNQCKINKVEVVWAPEGVTANLEVYDTPTGTLSGYPNVKLNQFGFNVAIAKDFHADESQYDADLIKDLKVKVTLTNSTDVAKNVGINFFLHELV
jgi:hypothetical protein